MLSKMNDLLNYNLLVKNYDIENFLKSRGVKYEKKSTYYLIEHCISCKKNRKMILNRESKFFKCFVCNFKGSLIKFIQIIDDISVPKVISLLKGQSFCTPTKKLDDILDSDLNKTELFKEQSLPHFSKIDLNDHSEVSIYLKKERGYTQELVDLFNIRYSPFQKRVIFPIYDHLNRLVGWQARDITGLDPIKILTQPKGFKKNTILYNFNRVKHESFVTIVEGPVDCHKSYQFNSVAILGKTISNEQINLLIGMENLNRIYIGLDPDANREISQLISEFCPYFNIKILNLPNGIKDLGDCNIDQANIFLDQSTDFSNNYGKIYSCLV